jgi:hypothetical protein
MAVQLAWTTILGQVRVPRPRSTEADDRRNLTYLLSRLRGRSVRPCDLPVHRSIFAIDVEESTSRTNPGRQEMREQIYRLLLKSLGAAGIEARHRDPFTDRGDGVLVLVHPVDDVPKPVLLSRLVPAFASLLCQYNRGAAAERSRPLRLRSVIHAGEVHIDSQGYYGEDLDVAFRLLEAPDFKAYHRQTAAPLGVIVSDIIYWSVVRHGYEGIDAGEFRPLMAVTVSCRSTQGWVYAPPVA